MYVPLSDVSVHPSWYAFQRVATALGKRPVGTATVKSSANTSRQPGRSPVGIASPDGDPTAGDGVDGDASGRDGDDQTAHAVATNSTTTDAASERREKTGTRGSLRIGDDRGNVVVRVRPT
jgi:hypothetical protein